MGFMDKFKDMVNPERDYEENDEYGYEREEYADSEQPAPSQSWGSASSGNALELKVVRPERFEAVTQIADHLINSRTVVLNLEATNKETARRMIDFLSGVAYSIEGQLKKVANNTFVITPGSVAVSGETAPESHMQATQTEF